MSAVDIEQLQPISRTYQYRKVMKPMLERKRRARINHCLDELKELMLSALQAEGENVSKLEKADILELTVQHLHKLRRQHRLVSSPIADVDRFRAGFTHCASEVSRCLASTPGVDVKLGTKLMSHLGHRLNDMEKYSSPLSVRINNGTCSPAPSSPSSISSMDSTSSSCSYNMPLTPTPSVSSNPCSRNSSPILHDSTSYNHNGLITVMDMSVKNSTSNSVWRPW